MTRTNEISPFRLFVYGLMISAIGMFFCFLFEGDLIQLLNGAWTPATVASALGYVIFTICERFLGPVLILAGGLLWLANRCVRRQSLSPGR